jgi:hypothetical protein
VSALLSLAERCERAEGPDRELDKDIVLALKPEAMFQTDDGYDEPIVFHAEPVVRWKHVLPRYTASIDAALTLAADKWDRVEFGRYEKVHDKFWADLGLDGSAENCASVPLAICAAALRARAAQEETQ